MARRCVLSGKGVQAGNNVSHAHNKTRRRFLPNLQRTSVMSDALDQTVRIRLSTRALRTIEHKGGFDAFLLHAADESLPAELRRLKKRIRKVRESAAPTRPA